MALFRPLSCFGLGSAGPSTNNNNNNNQQPVKVRPGRGQGSREVQLRGRRRGRPRDLSVQLLGVAPVEAPALGVLVERRDDGFAHDRRGDGTRRGQGRDADDGIDPGQCCPGSVGEGDTRLGLGVPRRRYARG